MRAVMMRGFGTPDKVRIEDMAIPEIGPDEVLVKVMAAGVNPVDWKEVEGNLQQFYPPYSDPWVPGFDAAGIIERVGADVTNVATGDRVMVFSDRYIGHRGSFAEYLCVPAHLCAHMPETIGFAEASSIPCAAMTGYQALFSAEKGALKAGDQILIHGASGGVGSFAVQFARAAGLHVAATCRTANVDYVKQLGAELVIDIEREEILPALRRWAPDGVEAIIDCVSAGSFPAAFDALLPGGRLISIATLTDDGDIAGDTAEAERRGVKKIFAIMNFDDLHEQFKPLAAMIDAGEIRMPPIKSYPLDKASEALLAMKQGGFKGKIVLEIGASRP